MMLVRVHVRQMRSKKLTISHLTIVDEKGDPRIEMHAFKDYAGISFYKGKGKRRYQAMHIYISEHHDGIIEIWNGAFTTALTLGAQKAGAGLSIFDALGRHVRGFGASYLEKESPVRKKKPKALKS